MGPAICSCIMITGSEGHEKSNASYQDRSAHSLEQASGCLWHGTVVRSEHLTLGNSFGVFRLFSFWIYLDSTSTAL